MKSNYPKFKKEKPKAEISLYDMNKQFLDGLGPASEDAITAFKETITKYCNDTNNHYYMLLSKEESYYTIFHINSESDETISNVIYECVSCFGTFYSGTIDEVGGIEIWVKNEEKNKFFYFKFFPYDLAVEEVNV